MPAPTNISQGDILLYRGTSLLSRAIRFFDGRPVNHAALYVGNDSVVEALGGGLEQRAFDESVADNDWVEYWRLKTDPGAIWPVIQRAGDYLQRKERYAYEQLLLLALLSTTRKLKVNRFLRFLLRKLLDKAADLLLELVPGDGEAMICSEFVFRCYEEAQPGSSDPYTLWVAPWPGLEALPGPPLPRSPRPAGARPGRIHPDSLLAWFAEESLPRSGPPAVVVTLALEESPTALAESARPEGPDGVEEMELEELLEAYLDEAQSPRPEGEEAVRAGAGPGAEASIRTPDVYAAMNRFLGAYDYAVIRRGDVEDREAAEGAPPGVPVLLGSTAELARTGVRRIGEIVRPVADFVTPGDLYECESLFSVGRVS